MFLYRVHAWSIVGLLLVAALIAGGCVGPLNLVTAEEPVSGSFEVGRSPRIIVETFNGAIEVTAGAAGQVAVSGTKRGSGPTSAAAQADLGNVEVSMTQDGDTIRVVARRTDRGLNMGNSGASFQLQVPADSALDLRSSNGSITASDVAGDATLQSSNGQLEVRGGRGRLDLRTSNGSLRIEAQDARVDAETSNGRITFDGSLAEGHHRFGTSNGSVDITLPAGSQFRIDASTSNGRVSTDFPVTVVGTQDDDNLSGTVGEDPAFSLQVDTSNGSIQIRQAP